MNFTFDGNISREVLENYLSRSVTAAGLYESKTLEDDLRAIREMGVKFLGRASGIWYMTMDDEEHFRLSKELADKVHAQDPEMILQSCVFEWITRRMETVEIPEIDVSLPVYHGTEEPVLQIAVGHLDWSSLPVGGESTHCVLSGHRGLPSAKLFTNLDKLREGDIFLLRILDEVLTYEVDQILIVEPQEVGALQIVEGQDYCTLVTCTPYGINTHRLLVRGHRIDNVEEAKTVRVTADAVQIEPLLMAPIVAIPILLLLLILLLLPKRPKTKHGGDADEDL